jgi:Na+(H+)/acetate symporter ActP
VGEGAIAPIRLIGSFIVPLVLVGIYLLFTSIEGAWIYFILGLLTSLYQLFYDLGTRFGIIDKGYTIINKTEDTIISIVFVVASVVLINGLHDKIYA